LQPSGISFET